MNPYLKRARAALVALAATLSMLAATVVASSPAEALVFHPNIPYNNCTVSPVTPPTWDGVGNLYRTETCWIDSYDMAGQPVVYQVVEWSYTSGLRRTIGNRYQGANVVYGAIPGIWVLDSVGTEIVNAQYGNPGFIEFCISSQWARRPNGDGLIGPDYRTGYTNTWGVDWDVPRHTLSQYKAVNSVSAANGGKIALTEYIPATPYGFYGIKYEVGDLVGSPYQQVTRGNPGPIGTTCEALGYPNEELVTMYLR